ncbi:hypothetical protein PF002_g25607 [Phytophthora fragariae]|uniref:Uncharacterized protein n=1 Tax=Phytophthora fragariae TaxID=53985 RepID=A0A6A3WM82_9STRA|nr:hypothetical protein PF002_g25607 [Phytophthora fragariae]
MLGSRRQVACKSIVQRKTKRKIVSAESRQQTFKCLNSESRTRKTISERHSSLWWLAPMEADADVSGNDSDATVVLEYVEDSNVETNATISNEPSSSDENVTSTAVEAGSGRDSESSLDFGSDSGEVSQPSDFVPTSKPTYTA